MTLATLAPMLAIGSGLAGLFVPRASAAGRVVVFGLLGLSGAAALVAGVEALIAAAPRTWELPLGLPWLAWHLRLDALSGFFLAVIGLVLVPVCLFGPGYTREFAQSGRS